MAEEVIVKALSFVVFIGSLINLIGAVGFIRFTNFYLRLHASTVSVIGGIFYSLITLSAISFLNGSYYTGCLLLLSASLVFILSPTGTHALSRAAYRRKAVQI